jgi:hypothetical protein
MTVGDLMTSSRKKSPGKGAPFVLFFLIPPQTTFHVLACHFSHTSCTCTNDFFFLSRQKSMIRNIKLKDKSEISQVDTKTLQEETAKIVCNFL